MGTNLECQPCHRTPRAPRTRQPACPYCTQGGTARHTPLPGWGRDWETAARIPQCGLSQEATSQGGGRGHGNSNGQVHRKSSEAPDAPARLGHPSPHTRHWKSLRHLAPHLPGDLPRHHDQRRQRRCLWQPTASLDGGIQQNNTEQSCLQCQPGLDHCHHHHHHHHHHHRATLATACERPRHQCWYLRRLYM